MHCDETSYDLLLAVSLVFYRIRFEFAGGGVTLHLFIPGVIIPRMKTYGHLGPLFQAQVLHCFFNLLDAHLETKFNAPTANAELYWWNLFFFAAKSSIGLGSDHDKMSQGRDKFFRADPGLFQDSFERPTVDFPVHRHDATAIVPAHNHMTSALPLEYKSQPLQGTARFFA
jgi:hypothetical protein